MKPREKFLERKVTALSDSELVSIIIGSGIKGIGFKKLSNTILSEIKNSSDSQILFERLRGIKGLGEVKSMRIVSALELGLRVESVKSGKGKRMLSSNHVYEYLKGYANKKQEYFISVYLNGRYEFIEKRINAVGSLNTISLHPRDVIIPGLLNHCAYIVVAHNHPSGESGASSEDVKFTVRLKKAIDIVGISLLDHIIITKSGWSNVPINR